MSRKAEPRRKYEAKHYPSPIDLPEGHSGSMAIRHRIVRAGESLPVIGMRQGLLRGQQPVRTILTEPLRIHELVENDHSIWMTDLPEELNQIQEMLYTVKPQGKVLVGGLGLGILAELVARLPEVESVTVVEISSDVIRLVAPEDREPYKTVQADIKDFLTLTEDRAHRYDYYLLDTWQGTSESTWWEEVMPLRRIIRNRWGKGPVIHCWAEDIMQGQIARSLMTTIPHWYYQHLPVPMDSRKAREFLRDVGLPTWERRFGARVDQAFLTQEEKAWKRALPHGA